MKTRSSSSTPPTQCPPYPRAACEACRQLKDALQAARATTPHLGQELATVSSHALHLMRDLALRGQHPAPSPTLDQDTLLHLVKLCHPDRWHGQPAEQLAHEVTVALNQLRQGRGQG